MTGINLVAVVVAMLAAFVMSTAWYIAFAKQRQQLSRAAVADMKRPQAAKMVGELIRSFFLACAIAYLVTHTGVASLLGAARLGLILWIGFPFVLLTGSIMWGGRPMEARGHSRGGLVGEDAPDDRDPRPLALDTPSPSERQAAFMSALVTDHFVLQTAASATVAEAASRTSLYVFSLSSSLVAMGFVSQFPETFRLFAAAILPALFVLGVFTTIRLVDTGIENQHFLRGIAHIRSYYRTLTPEAAAYFSAEGGRWPEAHAAPPLWSGALVAFLTTAATMIAFINTIVAGTGVTLLANSLVGRDQIRLAVSLGVAATVVLMAVFLIYQRWRYSSAGGAARREETDPRR